MPEDGESGVTAQPIDQPDAGSSETTGTATPVAGSGEQPPLPEVLPPHWQQRATAQMSFAVDPSTTSAPMLAASDDGDVPASGAMVSTASFAEGATSGSDQATAEQSNPRRRNRREEGERAPRVRKPRRGREDATNGEPAVGDGDEIASSTPTSQAVEVDHGRTMPAVETMPAPKPAIEIAAASPDQAPATTPVVTVIDDATSAEETSKRRGWWRRLMD